MTPLPKIGRPSITGLSEKALGTAAYQRLYKRHRDPLRGTRRPRWTGLSTKTLTRAEYVAQWRALRRQRSHAVLPA